jgi:hypothetical protein
MWPTRGGWPSERGGTLKNKLNKLNIKIKIDFYNFKKITYLNTLIIITINYYLKYI